MDWVFGIVDQSRCRASTSNITIKHLVFADDVVPFTESLKFLAMALKLLHEEGKSLKIKVSWSKIKLQLLRGLLDNTVQSLHACGEDVEVNKSFTYMGSVVYDDGGSHQVVT